MARRDLDGIYKQIYANEAAMKELGVIGKGPLYFGFVHESDENKTVLYKWEAGEKKEIKVGDTVYLDANGQLTDAKTPKAKRVTLTKSNIKQFVYKNARMAAGSSAAAFAWDRQNDLGTRNADKTISQKKWALLMDEIHRTLLQEANNSFAVSAGQRNDAETRAKLQEIAHDIAAELYEGTDYRVNGKNITIIGNKKEIQERFRKQSKGLDAFLTNEDITAFIKNSLLAAQVYKYNYGDEKSKTADYKIIVEDGKIKVEANDKNTDEDKKSTKFGNGLHYALELIVRDRIAEKESGYDRKEFFNADGTVKEIEYTYETNQNLSMTLNAFLNDGDIIEQWGGATGTIDANAFKTYYGKDVKVLGSAGGARPTQAGFYLTEDSESQKAKLTETLSRFGTLEHASA